MPAVYRLCIFVEFSGVHGPDSPSRPKSVKMCLKY